MKIRSKNLFKPRSIIAVALMFWCAGTGCMIVAYARATMSNEDSQAQAAEPLPGLSGAMSAHACCKARHKSLKQSPTDAEAASAKSGDAENIPLSGPTPTQSGVMNCCPLTSGSIVIASRPQANDRATVLPQANAAKFVLTDSNPCPLSVPLRLPNRSHSYLLDCSFLI